MYWVYGEQILDTGSPSNPVESQSWSTISPALFPAEVCLDCRPSELQWHLSRRQASNPQTCTEACVRVGVGVCREGGEGSLSAAAAVPELHLSPEGAAIGGILSLRLNLQDAYSLRWMVLPS